MLRFNVTANGRPADVYVTTVTQVSTVVCTDVYNSSTSMSTSTCMSNSMCDGADCHTASSRCAATAVYTDLSTVQRAALAEPVLWRGRGLTADVSCDCTIHESHRWIHISYCTQNTLGTNNAIVYNTPLYHRLHPYYAGDVDRRIFTASCNLFVVPVLGCLARHRSDGDEALSRCGPCRERRPNRRPPIEGTQMCVQPEW